MANNRDDVPTDDDMELDEEEMIQELITTGYNNYMEILSEIETADTNQMDEVVEDEEEYAYFFYK